MRAVQGIPVLVHNGQPLPYRGTVVTGMPALRGMSANGIVPIEFVRAPDGEVFEADYEILSTHDDNTVKWALVGVSGIFDPGDTLFYARGRFQYPPPYFIPQYHALLMQSTITMEEIPQGLAQLEGRHVKGKIVAEYV